MAQCSGIYIIYNLIIFFELAVLSTNKLGQAVTALNQLGVPPGHVQSRRASLLPSVRPGQRRYRTIKQATTASSHSRIHVSIFNLPLDTIYNLLPKATLTEPEINNKQTHLLSHILPNFRN